MDTQVYYVLHLQIIKGSKEQKYVRHFPWQLKMRDVAGRSDIHKIANTEFLFDFYQKYYLIFVTDKKPNYRTIIDGK